MKNWREVAKPPGVAELPVDERGYPIFFAIQPPPGRALDFRVLNVENHLRVAKEKLCAICGRKLGYWLTFIGGPMCVKGRGTDEWREGLKAHWHGGCEPPRTPTGGLFGIFGDGPMHRECAEYALQVCPFLTIPTMKYSKEPSEKVPNTTMDANVITTRPERILLYTTRSYRLEPAPGGKPVFRTGSPKKLEWLRPGDPIVELTAVKPAGAV